MNRKQAAIRCAGLLVGGRNVLYVTDTSWSADEFVSTVYNILSPREFARHMGYWIGRKDRDEGNLVGIWERSTLAKTYQVVFVERRVLGDKDLLDCARRSMKK